MRYYKSIDTKKVYNNYIELINKCSKSLNKYDETLVNLSNLYYKKNLEPVNCVMDIKLCNNYVGYSDYMMCKNKCNSMMCEYDNSINNIVTSCFGHSMTPVECEIHTGIDNRYILYMEKYGVPENGIFDPVKLSEFK